MTPAETAIASEMMLLEAEREIDRLKAELKEANAILEKERLIHIKIAMQADKLHMQLQAIREAAIGELCSLIAEGPENLNGLQEIE